MSALLDKRKKSNPSLGGLLFCTKFKQEYNRCCAN
jgi:hypothetical protein